MKTVMESMSAYMMYNKLINKSVRRKTTAAFSRVGGLSFTSRTLTVTVPVALFPPGWPYRS